MSDVTSSARREVAESSGVKIQYEAGMLMPSGIRYTDGTFVEFAYDDELQPTIVRERSGLVWRRVGLLGDDAFAVWQTGEAHPERLAIAIQPSGSYQRKNKLGIMRTVIPSGRYLFSYLFPVGFDVASAARTLFSAADNNLDRALTRSELERAAVLRWPNAELAAFAQVLRLSFKHIVEMRDDPMMRDAGGLEYEELLRHAGKADMVLRSSARQDVDGIFSEVFDAADTDGDGMVCLDAIEAEVAQLPWLPNQRLIVELLLRFSSKLTTFADFGFNERSDWIFKAEFLKLGRAVYDDLVQQRTLPCGWLIEESAQRLSRSDTPLFQTASGIDSVLLDAVEQGACGSSYLHAVVAGLVAANPNSVLQMVSELENGAYSVKFPGVTATQQPITFEMAGSLEISLRSRNTKHGAWVSVLDKAFSLLRDTQPDAVALLTNRPADWHRLADLSDEDLKVKLAENFRQRRIVLCCADSRQLDTSFAVTKFNKDLGTLTVWNHSWSLGTMTLFQGAEKLSENSFNLSLQLLRSKFDGIYCA